MDQSITGFFWLPLTLGKPKLLISFILHRAVVNQSRTAYTHTKTNKNQPKNLMWHIQVSQ